MLSRLFTWLFYAVVFFLLGAWVGGFSPGLRALMREGGAAAVAGYQQAHTWAVATINRPTPTSDPTPTDPLLGARAAYERGDINRAIALYRERLTSNPDDTDARGELGNVLSNAGRVNEAAAAYYEVAIQLARAGHIDRARALEPVIRRDDAALADRLATALRTMRSGG